MTDDTMTDRDHLTRVVGWSLNEGSTAERSRGLIRHLIDGSGSADLFGVIHFGCDAVFASWLSVIRLARSMSMEAFEDEVCEVLEALRRPEP